MFPSDAYNITGRAKDDALFTYAGCVTLENSTASLTLTAITSLPNITKAANPNLLSVARINKIIKQPHNAIVGLSEPLPEVGAYSYLLPLHCSSINGSFDSSLYYNSFFEETVFFIYCKDSTLDTLKENLIILEQILSSINLAPLTTTLISDITEKITNKYDSLAQEAGNYSHLQA